MTAIGVLREAYEYGLKIPAQLSAIGFDDIRLAQFTTPPLTSIQMSQSLQAELAFKALLTAERNESEPEARRRLEGSSNWLPVLCYEEPPLLLLQKQVRAVPAK